VILQGDARALPLADESVHCCVTSPPYWGMRDYEVGGQIGLEEDIEAWVDALLCSFAEVWRVLRPASTIWVNVGDRYVTSPSGPRSGHAQRRELWHRRNTPGAPKPQPPLPRKSLIGLPWCLAFALQEQGWTLRCDVIWHKPSVMPETVHDRPTRAHMTTLVGARLQFWEPPPSPQKERPSEGSREGAGSQIVIRTSGCVLATTENCFCDSMTVWVAPQRCHDATAVSRTKIVTRETRANPGRCAPFPQLTLGEY
jgi:hypothetical protein